MQAIARFLVGAILWAAVLSAFFYVTSFNSRDPAVVGDCD